ncbi:ferredoxin [Streptomyces sp. BI20]|uniref:ferredoxin n=1 Tax=Streptomyces sp. BI20 TaxID=3403460 RepID=UPI003C75753B
MPRHEEQRADGGLVEISFVTDRCIGAGQCALTAPAVFTQDDDGFGALLPDPVSGDGPRAAGPLVREAARACPVSAITVRPA